MLRLFIAIPLDETTKQRLAQIIDDLASGVSGIRWVKPEGVHLTVKFLGDTEPSRVNEIAAAIDIVAQQCQSVSATIDRIGAFPNLNRPRALWVGPSQPVEPAATVARLIDQEMQSLSFKRESRPFKPHLTLGRANRTDRVSGLSDLLGSYRLEPFKLTLDRLVLLQSTLTPKGAIYRNLHEATLPGERFTG